MDALTFLRADHEGVLGMIESLERGRGNSDAEIGSTAGPDQTVTSPRASIGPERCHGLPRNGIVPGEAASRPMTDEPRRENGFAAPGG